MMFEKVTTSVSLYEAFKPIFLLTRICCLLPVRIQKTARSYSIAWSWTNYAFSLFGLVSLELLIVCGLVQSYRIEDVYNIRLKEMSGMFITILDDSYLLLTFVLATVLTPFSFKHFNVYFKCLNKADDLLKHQQPNEKRTCCIVVFVTLTLTVAILIYDIVLWSRIFLRDISVGLFFFYSVPFYLTYFLVMVIELNFWFVVYMVNVRLKRLNDSMVKEFAEYASNEKIKVIRKVKGDPKVGVLKENEPGLSSKIIADFIKTYDILFEASAAINSFSGLNILMVVIGCMVHLLVTPYDLYLEIKNKDHRFIFSQFCWMVCHVLRLLLVVEPCHVAKQQVKRASALVYKFFSLDLSEEIHSQLEIFALQLLHCPIEYTAFDLFVLNRTLLAKITGGVTTYLVILFQFDK